MRGVPDICGCMAAMLGAPSPGAGPASPRAGAARPAGASRSEGGRPAAVAVRFAVFGAGGLSTAIETTHSPLRRTRPRALLSSFPCVASKI